MFRLSKLTDYAMVVLVRLAKDGAVQTSPGIAACTAIPEPTVAKVLKALAVASLVRSTRGARGGYTLDRPAETITIAQVIEAIDGPIALTACVDGGGCEVGGTCPMHRVWDPVNEAIRGALDGITLAQMAANAHPIGLRFIGELAAVPALLPTGD
jgi:FeS assembly SUF system regulator